MKERFERLIDQWVSRAAFLDCDGDVMSDFEAETLRACAAEVRAVIGQ